MSIIIPASPYLLASARILCVHTGTVLLRMPQEFLCTDGREMRWAANKAYASISKLCSCRCPHDIPGHVTCVWQYLKIYCQAMAESRKFGFEPYTDFQEVIVELFVIQLWLERIRASAMRIVHSTHENFGVGPYCAIWPHDPEPGPNRAAGTHEWRSGHEWFRADDFPSLRMQERQKRLAKKKSPN